MRRRDHRRRHHPRRHGDDGQAGDPCGRGFRPCGLSARRRGAADRRARRAAGRGRSPDRAGRGDRRAMRRRQLPRQRQRGGAAAVLGRAQGGLSRRSAASRPTTTASTAPSRAAQLPDVLQPHGASCRRNTGCASPTSSMPATAISIRSSSTTPTSRASSSAPRRFGADILRYCVEVGGVLTGEHGVGVEKRDLMGTMFNEADLDQQSGSNAPSIPQGLLNPGKVFPQLHRCAELGRLHVHRGQVPLPRPAAFLRSALEPVPPHRRAAAGRDRRRPRSTSEEPLEIVGRRQQARPRPPAAGAAHVSTSRRFAGIRQLRAGGAGADARARRRRWPRSRRRSRRKRPDAGLRAAAIGARCSASRAARPDPRAASSPATWPGRAASARARRATISSASRR